MSKSPVSRICVELDEVVAIGVTAAGEREVLGLDIGSSEDGAFWAEFVRGLVARGLSGFELVISDAHVGLKEAIPAVLSGASWQRRRVHSMRNALVHGRSTDALRSTSLSRRSIHWDCMMTHARPL